MRPPPPSCSTHGVSKHMNTTYGTPTLAHTTHLTQCMLHTACGRSMRPLQHCCGSCKRVQCQQSKAARPLTRQHVLPPSARAGRSCTLVRAWYRPDIRAESAQYFI